jgi:small neutral amino acid transporter SnatA (MarC family)
VSALIIIVSPLYVAVLNSTGINVADKLYSFLALPISAEIGYSIVSSLVNV